MSGAAAAAGPRELRGRIGLASAVFALVGYIIGGSIFIMPGALSAEIGPALFVSYLLAAGLTLFICFASAAIGSAFPMSGGTYVAVSTAVSPFWGAMVVWMGVLIIFTSPPALAYGLVDYLSAYIPVLGEHRFLGAISSVVLFTIVNLCGIRTAVWAQVVMVVVFMVVLLGVGIGGLAHSSAANFTPLFPLGAWLVVKTAIPAFYSFSGFSAIVTFGGEIENPRRNIPRVLLISFPIIVVTYLLVALAVPGVVPWRELSHGNSTLSAVASRFLPPWISTVVAAAAVCAIATTINGMLLSKSRDLFSLSIDRVLPKAFSSIGPFGEPRVALIFMCAVAISGIALRRSFTEYASMAVLCVMVVHVLQGIVILVLPRRLPRHYAAAGYKLNEGGRLFWGIGLVVLATVFIAAGLMGDYYGGVIYLAACALGAAGYFVRRAALRRRGLSIEALLLEHASSVVPQPAAGASASR